MKTFALKITIAVIAILTFSFANAFAQDSTKMNMEHNHKMEMGKDMHHHMNEEMEMDSSESSTHSIQRTGEIDLESIDANKDGKVFQDQMDWNVISDEPGECPVCGMKLKEVTLEKAKENLTKNGFKVK